MSQTKTIRILTEFAAVIDLDLCVLKLIQEKYNNPEFVRQDIMHLNLHDVKVKLLNRTHECPLSICIDDLENAIDIYNEIVETRYTDLLSYHTPTGIFKLMDVYNKNDGTDVTILCKSKEEANLISQYDNSMKTIVSEHKDINIEEYDIFVLKSVSNILSFPNKFDGKWIFILDYRYNLNIKEDGFMCPDMKFTQFILPFNKPVIVNTYSEEENVKLIKATTNLEKSS